MVILLEQPVRESNPPFRREGPVSCADRRTDQHISAPGRSRTCKACQASGLRPLELANAQPTHLLEWRRRESNPQSRRFELRRFAFLRTTPSFAQTPSTGFGPAISCVTGRRALRTAPRGQQTIAVAQVGVEPTASLVLSQGGLPVAYRAEGARSGIRTHKHRGLSRAALPFAYPGISSPGRTRTADRHLVRVLPSPLGYRTMRDQTAEAGIEPT